MEQTTPLTNNSVPSFIPAHIFIICNIQMDIG